MTSVVDDHGASLDAADRKDRDLRLTDDRLSRHGAEHAGIRDGERAALNVLDLQLLVSCPVGQILNRAAQVDETEPVGMANHWDDEALIERDGDAEIDVLFVHDRVAVDRCVGERILADRVGRRFRDEHRVSQPGAGRLVRRLVFSPQRVDAAEIDLERRVHVW